MLKNLEEKVNKQLVLEFSNKEIVQMQFSPPPQHTKADMTTNWAMLCSKILKKNPIEIAETAKKVLKSIDEIKSVEIAKPGFLNITLSDKFINELAENFDNTSVKPKSKPKILIEFVSANPTGPLHVASGRGASLGDSLVKIFRALGYQCDAEYYVNDAGNQAVMLGKSLKARTQGKEPSENGYHGDYLVELAKTLEKGKTEKEYQEVAVNEMLKTHKRDMKEFRVDFDSWFLESQLYKDDELNKTLKFLESKKLSFKKDKATWFGSQSDEDDKDRVLVKSNGLPTYFLADIAYHKNKYDRGYDKLVDILGADHHGYVPRMKAAIKSLGKKPEQFEPIIHQLVHLIKDGEQVKMSKRAGTFLSLKGLMEDVGVDACRFFFALRTPNSHMNFDLDLAKKKTNENPVFYVQYAHARISSILKKAKEEGFESAKKIEKIDENEKQVLVKLAWFENVLEICTRDLSPHHLANYLIELASMFHSFYDQNLVVDKKNKKTTEKRLLLVKQVKETISKGLYLIGVDAPESM